jgi:type II pantothenate kinase
MASEADPLTADAPTARATSLQHALDVRIDVKGAYIVDSTEEDNNQTPSEEFDTLEDIQHDSKDIRLPHHRSVVSHMAVDVSDLTRPPRTHNI